MGWRKPKSIGDAVAILKRHKKKAFFPAVAGMVGLIVASLFIPRQYNAEAKFERRLGLTATQTQRSDIAVRRVEADRRLLAEDLKGRSALEQLVEDLELTRGMPRVQGELTPQGQMMKMDLIRKLSSRIYVRVQVKDDDNELIAVSFDSDDRDLAPKLVNRLMNNYIRKSQLELEETLKLLLRGPRKPRRLLRIFIAQRVEREAAARGKMQRLLDRGRMIAEKPRHFGGAFEMPLGVGGEQETRSVDRRLLADAGEHVGEPSPLGRMIERVIDGEERNARGLRDRGEFVKARRVVGCESARAGEPDIAGKGAGERGEHSFSPLPRAGEGPGVRVREREKLALAEFKNILKRQMARALRRAPLAARQQFAEPAIGGAIGRKGDDVGARLLKAQPRRGNELQPRFFRGGVGAHDSGEGIDVGEGERGMAERGRHRRHLLGMRGAFKEREVRKSGKLCVSGHERPCIADALTVSYLCIYLCMNDRGRISWTAARLYASSRAQDGSNIARKGLTSISNTPKGRARLRSLIHARTFRRKRFAQSCGRQGSTSGKPGKPGHETELRHDELHCCA